jgi:hypothetical protein
MTDIIITRGEQARTVRRAMTVGFALALIHPLSELLSKGYPDPIDPLNPFNGEIISYWVGALGVVPLLAAVIAVAITGRKAGWGSSIVNVGVAALLVPAVTIPLVIITASALQPMGEYPFAQDGVARTQFMAGLQGSCEKKQANYPKPAGTTQATVVSFCRCIATEMAAVETRYDIDHTDQIGAKMATISQECTAEIPADQRW